MIKFEKPSECDAEEVTQDKCIMWSCPAYEVSSFLTTIDSKKAYLDMVIGVIESIKKHSQCFKGVHKNNLPCSKYWEEALAFEEEIVE